MPNQGARAERIAAAVGRDAADRRKTEVHSIRLTTLEGDLVERACIATKKLLVEFMHDAIVEAAEAACDG